MSTMMMLRKRRLLKIVLLISLISVIPYIIVSNIEPQNLYESGKFYYDTAEVKIGKSSNSSPFLPLPQRLNTTAHMGDNKNPEELVPTMESELPSTTQYCNSPFRTIFGHEGGRRDGFKLRMVHVFVRHGDRTPLHTIPGNSAVNFNCNFSSWYNGSNPKFKRFVDHMSKFTGKQQRKSHFRNWALLPSKKKCENSDLTSLGALQQLKNGEFLAGRYLGQDGLFDKRLSLTSQVYVRSTTTPRTYQSAVAFMYGFLPFFNVTQVNIDHAANKYMCSTSSRMVLTCSCSYLSTLEQRAKKYKSAVNANSSEYALIKAEVAKLFNFGENNYRMPWLSAIIDAIVPAVCHNTSKECQESKREGCVNETLLRRMWREYARSQASTVSDPDKNYIKFLSIQSHPVALEMVRRMRDLIEGRFVQKFVLYSGHDFTINAFLHVLGLHDNSWPSYASRLHFELFERTYNDISTRKDSKFYFKVLLNGHDLTESVSFCKSTSIRGFCEFRRLVEFVFGHMIRRFGYTSYSDACSRKR